VLLLGFELNLICDPAIVPLSRAAIKRHNKSKTTAQSLLLVVTKGVHPVSYSNSMGKERRYVPTNLCVTAHSAYLTSFLSTSRQISFNHNNAQTEKMSDAAAAQIWQQPLLMPRKTVVDEVLNSQDLGLTLYHHNKDSNEGRA
jgi:hypothetical protein